MSLDASSTISLTATRKTPFLHRTWLAAMGPKTRETDNDDYDSRAAKRRRTARNSPDSGIGLEPLDAVSLSSNNGQAEKALRIELLNLQHKDTTRFRSNPFNGPASLQVDDGYEASVRCRISIRGHEPGGLGESKVHDLLVDSQICTMRTFRNPAGHSNMARINLPQPFNVPQDKILVPREEDSVLALAERYSARIRLEPVGDANWPPGFINPIKTWFPSMPQTRHRWVLHATIDDLFQWQRNKAALTLEEAPGMFEADTDYVLDVDVRWSSILSSKAMKRLDKDVRPSITCSGDGDQMDLDIPALDGANGVEEHLNGTCGLNGSNGVDGDGDFMEDVDDHGEGDLTPGRRRRTRPQINYNLKLLSDKAQQRERRRRQRQKAKNGMAEPTEDTGVTYLLREQFHMDDLSCVLCGVPPFRNFELLRLHYKLIHEDYAFIYEQNPPRVSISRSFGVPGPVLATEDYQLGPPKRPFDLTAFLDGDESWVTSRQGSDNGNNGGPYRTAGPRSQMTLAANLLSKGPSNKITVPKTKTTLYHPLSKAPLQPGTEIDRYVADERWLIHKHRDTLGDFTDLEPAEIEFMQMWDSYFLPLHLSSELFLPRHYLAFAKEKADWIVAKQERAIEFGKHMAVLQIRGVIQDEHVVDVTAIIQEANERRDDRAAKTEQAPEKQPEQPPKRTENGCAKCGRFVERGPAWLKCVVEGCPAPLYHDYCATENLVETNKRDEWKCNDCCTSRAEDGSL